MFLWEKVYLYVEIQICDIYQDGVCDSDFQPRGWLDSAESDLNYTIHIWEQTGQHPWA